MHDVITFQFDGPAHATPGEKLEATTLDLSLKLLFRHLHRSHLYPTMADDWQDAAFSSRHMHNKRGSMSKRSFDVRKTFGTYEVKCSAWQKLDQIPSDATASLELYRLTENQEGVVGELALPSALHAAVVLAGSRQTLRRTVEDMEDDDDDDSDEEEEEDDDPEQNRFETFEKNSFRTPKFWFRWSGAPTSIMPSSPKTSKSHGAGDDVETGLGYIVFSGNDCRKFKGTINCEALGWKDVALSGHKIAPRSESDVPVVWGRGGVAI
jgi:hypothetical protein